MVALVTLSCIRKAERRAAEERRRQEAIEEAERYRRQQIRDNSLKVLHRIEGMAERWERAERLRAFAGALQLRGAEVSPEDVDHREAQVAWIRKRADWLDPLVRAPWPDVAGSHRHYYQEEWVASYTNLEGMGVDDVLVKATPADS
jgi:hypothetical protein